MATRCWAVARTAAAYRLFPLLEPAMELLETGVPGGVEEVLIVDPEARTVEWFEHGTAGFVSADGSRLRGD